MMMGPYRKWAFLSSLTFETILNCPIVLQRLEVIYVYAVQLQKNQTIIVKIYVEGLILARNSPFPPKSILKIQLKL